MFSEEDNESLLNEENHAKALGVKGVPCFIINKKFVLYGAQTKENFINIFNSITDVWWFLLCTNNWMGSFINILVVYTYFYLF